MDKFMEMMEKMQAMSPKEQQKSIAEKKSMCICGSCPSYNKCASDGNELLYCALGKLGNCITEEKGCICPSCPVTEMMGLTNMFFCTRDAEKVQRGM